MPLRCVVTAGPTCESLDAVRRLTNFSTGKLGGRLSTFLTDRGHEVVLLRGEAATWSGETRAAETRRFTSTADLQTRLRELAATGVDAVFHAAAVSDFTFGRVFAGTPESGLTELASGKFSTRQGTLLAELVPTPKIIAGLRGLFPQARIVGWKYEVEGDRASVMEAGRRQMAECATDACVLNGPAYGFGFGLARPAGSDTRHFTDTTELYAALEAVAAGG